MSLYEEALAAGATLTSRGFRGGSLDPSRNLSPELVQRILAGEEVDGYTLSRGYNQRQVGTGESFAMEDDLSSPVNLILGRQSGSGFHTQQQDAYDEFGNYIGEASGDSDSLSIAKFAAMAAGGYYGTGALNGMQAGASTALTGADAAMADLAASGGFTGAEFGASSFGVAPQAVDATTALTGAETGALSDGAMQTIEVVGSKLPATAPLDVSAAIPGTIGAAELALPEIASDPAVDTSNYSNEGRNYPTTESTQGPGGSPVNASQFPGTEMRDVNGNVIPPVTQNGGTTNLPGTTTTNPFGTGSLSDLFNVLSGLYGLKLANDAAEKSDPFGPYRKGYADKLLALEANPGLLKSTPGFLAGQDAIERQMASKGYLGSGNMAGALMRYGGDSYHNEANRLATLAGANIAPGNTYFNQAQLSGQALSNIGYGLAPYMQGGPR